MSGAPVWVIVNPAAGRGRAAGLWPALAAHLRQQRVPFRYAVTAGPRAATGLTRRALRAGTETVVAVGGDGTVNEVVNGFFLDGALVHPTASLAIVPAGSSCDLARNLGIPAGRAALDLVANGHVTAIDVGRAIRLAAGRPAPAYFLNNADVGIGARIARHARRFRRFGARPAFFLATAVVLAHPAPWWGRLALDGRAATIRAVTVVVAQGSYTAGGMHLAPGARMDDGLFDVLTIGAMPPAELLLNLLRVYSGAHLQDHRVRLRRACSVQVRTGCEPLIQVDGEEVGVGSAAFTVLPGALRVHLPRPRAAGESPVRRAVPAS
jgi:YegS/Rv2252/BmrU family lipid kinase